MTVHNIHISVDEEEYNKLVKRKGSRTWYEFILQLKGEGK
jgi:predicted CopG family antitoxin